MAVVMFMQWKGVTRAQYDAVRALVNWEGDVPEGAKFHVAAITEDGIRVTDLWESADAFHRFVETRLMPGVKQVGIAGEPQVDIYPAHAVFTPSYVPA